MRKHNNEILFKTSRNPQGEGKQKTCYSNNHHQISTNPKRFQQGQYTTINYGKQQNIITNLRSQLTNLKHEVAKLMQKDSNTIIPHDSTSKIQKVNSNLVRQASGQLQRSDSIFRKNSYEKQNQEWLKGYQNRESQRNKIGAYNIYHQLQKLRNQLKNAIQRQKQLLNDRGRLLQALENQRKKQLESEIKKQEWQTIKEKQQLLGKKIKQNEQLIGNYRKNQQIYIKQIQSLKVKLNEKHKKIENLQGQYKKLQFVIEKASQRQKELQKLLKSNQHKNHQSLSSFATNDKLKKMQGDFDALLQTYEKTKDKLIKEQTLTIQLNKKVQQLQKKHHTHHRSKSKDFVISKNSFQKDEDQLINQLKQKDKLINNLLSQKKYMQNDLRQLGYQKTQIRHLNGLIESLNEQIIKLRLSIIKNKYINW